MMYVLSSYSKMFIPTKMDFLKHEDKNDFEEKKIIQFFSIAQEFTTFK